MNLNFFRNISNNLRKKNETVQFMEELQDSLENLKTNSQGFLDRIESKRKISKISKNTIKIKADELIEKYANSTIDRGTLYYIDSRSNQKKDTYVIYKYGNGNNDTINLNQSELPKNSKIDSVLRYEYGKYILDEKATKELEREIEKISNEILDRTR